MKRLGLALLAACGMLVAIGAGERITGTVATRVCKFFGEISYPLYITHYPLIYIYTAIVTSRKTPALQGAIWGALLLITAVTIAYACLKLYDEPLRRWLTRRLVVRTAAPREAVLPAPAHR